MSGIQVFATESTTVTICPCPVRMVVLETFGVELGVQSLIHPVIGIRVAQQYRYAKESEGNEKDVLPRSEEEKRAAGWKLVASGLNQTLLYLHRGRGQLVARGEETDDELRSTHACSWPESEDEERLREAIEALKNRKRDIILEGEQWVAQMLGAERPEAGEASSL